MPTIKLCLHGLRQYGPLVTHTFYLDWPRFDRFLQTRPIVMDFSQCGCCFLVPWICINGVLLHSTYTWIRYSASFWAKYDFPVPLGPHKIILRCSISKEIYLWRMLFGTSVSKANESILFSLDPEIVKFS